MHRYARAVAVAVAAASVVSGCGGPRGKVATEGAELAGRSIDDIARRLEAVTGTTWRLPSDLPSGVPDLTVPAVRVPPVTAPALGARLGALVERYSTPETRDAIETAAWGLACDAATGNLPTTQEGIYEAAFEMLLSLGVHASDEALGDFVDTTLAAVDGAPPDRASEACATFTEHLDQL